MRHLAIILTALLLLIGCTDRVSYDYGEISTWSDLFTTWHHTMDTHYIFWDLDSPRREWDNVYDEYLPLFDKLTSPIGDDKAETEEAFRLFWDVTKNLSDGHYTLKLTDGEEELVISPSYIRVLSGYGIPEDDIYHYLRTNEMTTAISQTDLFAENEINIVNDTLGIALSDDWTGMMTESNDSSPILEEYTIVQFGPEYGLPLEGYPFTGVIGKTSDDILYVLPSSFTFAAYINDAEDGIYDSSNTPYAIHFLQLLYTAIERHNDGTEPLSGIIIDLRGNNGGYGSDINALWGGLVKDDVTFALQRRKLGSNRLTYGPWAPWLISGSGETDIDIPIVLLVNSGTASCGELTTMFFHALHDRGFDVTVIGSPTMGANGAIASTADELAAGTFAIDPYIELAYTASIATVYYDGESFEGNGVPVDVAVPFDYSSFVNGTDARLVKALEVIREGVSR